MKLKFFELARKVSRKSDHHQHSVGCVIVKKNRVVDVGFNQIKTHSKSPHPHKMLHAEISALIGNTYKNLQDCEAYVYRQRKDGYLGLSKPCPSCELALRLAGIKKVHYTTSENGYKTENYWR